MVSRNEFCFRYGKAEPEWLLTTVARHGPMPRAQLYQHHTRMFVDRWLPRLIARGDAEERDGLVSTHLAAGDGGEE